MDGRIPKELEKIKKRQNPLESLLSSLWGLSL
jgi:hypothetical protein